MEPAHYRVSKSAWLEDEEHTYVRNVGQRITDMTGLSLESAEKLQVVNYGIGGHYEPHIDFFTDDEENCKNNRIATVLVYVRKLFVRKSESIVMIIYLNLVVDE